MQPTCSNGFCSTAFPYYLHGTQRHHACRQDSAWPISAGLSSCLRRKVLLLRHRLMHTMSTVVKAQQWLPRTRLYYAGIGRRSAIAPWPALSDVCRNPFRSKPIDA
ncbi:hypothetical protein CB0940_08437 [Cercospora beticola]|uniref:Uncharacterized protein n=1 Tax=Cercospora beticola TaxID=122368 RepID=A0A2G5HP51_CERBT|nr:hypothetical protein CB0940_08437 [Cercospora beticola]PIA94321.1 hypothetical protein CB0940_08437 [Cercospora beticola]